MVNVVFMGTPDFAVPVLKMLIDTQTVVGVVTQPDRPAGRGKQLRPSPVKITAQEANIPIYQPKSLRSEEAAQPLRDWQPDIIVVAAFGQILRPHVLDLPPHGCLNLHASLLPRWRGASPIQHAILAGDVKTGICLMKMDVGLDTGPVYACQSTPISPTETAASLHDRLAEMGATLLATHLDDIVAGKLIPTAQDDEQSTYAPMISKEDGRLNWQQTSAEIDRRIRAMSPWPGAFTSWQGKMLKIKAGSVANGRLPTGNPGQVIAYEEGAAVLTADGALTLDEIQLAGKRVTAVPDFLRGHANFIGSKLGTEN
ncbi:methionyl-tRNA formyltransferase [Candidatus Leptofilum sp.]|uniref:methionyl-tRNA formyltransferase n=1 Tax=Candidatus Leptofilum sp. TaxID=3241576 RepID=UPI003B5B4062